MRSENMKQITKIMKILLLGCGILGLTGCDIRDLPLARQMIETIDEKREVDGDGKEKLSYRVKDENGDSHELESLSADSISYLEISSRADGGEYSAAGGYPEDVRIRIDFEKGTICRGKEDEFWGDDASPEVKDLTKEQCDELKELIIEYSSTVEKQEKEYWPQSDEYPEMMLLFEYELWLGEQRYKQDGALCYPDGWSEFIETLMEY